MRRTAIVFMIVMSSVLCSYIAVAVEPGDYVPLRLTNKEIGLTGLPIIGDYIETWRPAYVKYYLVDPNGKIRSMHESQLDSVQKSGTTWILNDDSGLLRVPAFAEAGEWTVRAKIYDINKVFVIQWSNKIIFDSYSFNVRSNSMKSLFAPYSFYINLGGNILTGELEFSFSTPDIIFIIAAIVVLFVVIINLKLLLGETKKKSRG